MFRKALEGLFIDRMEQNEEITAKFMNEDQFREAVSRHLLKCWGTLLPSLTYSVHTGPRERSRMRAKVPGTFCRVTD
jgi:hypothetical protein